MKFQRFSDGKIVDGYRHSFGAPDLLALSGFLTSRPTVPLKDAAGEATVVRHDVDHNLEHALRFARWEARQGIRATYYVLPTAWYWNDPTTPAQIRGIAALGHEIGIHQDTVAEAFRRGYGEPIDGSALPVGNCEVAAEILREQIGAVRRMGVEVFGTSTHGTHLWKSDGITNCFLWAVGYTAGDFGLQYADAYHLHQRALYISDNRGAWSLPLRTEPGRASHVLIHPAHWDLERLLYANEVAA